MIDDKKIEAAKEEIYEDRFLLNGEEIVFNNDEKEEMFYEGDIKEAIGLGAKWAINEFLDDLNKLIHPAKDINISNMEDFQKRMLDEHSELKDRWTKLNAALAKDGFREKVGDYQYKMMVKQASGMQEYYNALRNRMVDAGIIEAPDCAS